MGQGGSHLINPGHPGRPSYKRQAWLVHHDNRRKQDPYAMMQQYTMMQQPSQQNMMMQQQPNQQMPMPPAGVRMPGWSKKRGNPPLGYNDWNNFDDDVDYAQEENTYGQQDIANNHQRNKMMRQMQQMAGLRPQGMPFGSGWPRST